MTGGGPPAETVVRGGSRTPPPPGPLALGGRVSWGTLAGKAGDCVLQSSRALATAAHWRGPGLDATANVSPHPHLRDLVVAAVCMDRGLQNPADMHTHVPPPRLGSLRSPRAS